MLSPTFSRNTLDLHGETGRTWLENLPAFLDHFARRWSLTLLPPSAELSYNYVAPALRADGTLAVFKAHVPGENELAAETAALHFYAGRGCCRLLEADPGAGAILLERLTPGHMLTEIPDDDEATRIAAEVMLALWKPWVREKGPFPSTKDWAAGISRLRETFGGGTGPFPHRLVEQAEQFFGELHATPEPPVLLHGDLHHFNILSATREPWLAIDPKGVIGEPAYETGALLRNPIDTLYTRPDWPRITARRVALLAEHLSLDRQRILRWGIAQAVLSAWWNYEDHLHLDEEVLRLAEVLAALPGAGQTVR